MKHEQQDVLIIDDDPSLRELMDMLLTCNGYTVNQAGNGQEGQEQVKHASYKLIILDLMMPLMDGITFLRWLRKEQQCDTPVVMLTAVGKEEKKQQLMLSGANAVLDKPIDPDQFVQQIQKMLG